jgi:hypothetical protein
MSLPKCSLTKLDKSDADGAGAKDELKTETSETNGVDGDAQTIADVKAEKAKTPSFFTLDNLLIETSKMEFNIIVFKEIK